MLAALQTALQRAETMDPASLSLLQKSSSRSASADNGASAAMGRGILGYQTLPTSDESDTSRPPRKVSYSDTTKKNENHNHHRDQDHHSLRRRNGAASSEEADGPAKANSSKPSWTKETFRKFQSLELENKGSVARDHLALGMSHMSLPPQRPRAHRRLRCMSRRNQLIDYADLSFFSFTSRAHLSSMATNLFSFCIHWRRRDAAVPPQYRLCLCEHGRFRSHKTAKDGPAIGCDIPRDQHRDAAAGLQTLFSRTGMDPQGQVSGQSRDHPHHVIRGAGPHDFVTGGCHCHTTFVVWC